MNDPRRWSDDDGGGTALEQELFRSGQSRGMSPAERKQIWLAIAEQAAMVPVGTGAAPQAGSVGKAATGLAKVAWLKGIAAVSLLAGAGAGLWGAAHHEASPAAVRQLPASAPVTMEAPTASSPVARERDVPVAVPAEPSFVGKTTARATQSAGKNAAKATASVEKSAEPAANAVAVDSRLAEEARAVLDVRRALASGNAAGALAQLDAARVEFPKGALGQEREALAIEALAATGQRKVASGRAAAFLARFPGSPHASNVRRFVVEP